MPGLAKNSRKTGMGAALFSGSTPFEHKTLRGGNAGSEEPSVDAVRRFRADRSQGRSPVLRAPYERLLAKYSLAEIRNHAPKQKRKTPHTRTSD